MSRYVAEENNTFPYNLMAYVQTTFPDGSSIYGSGSLVGRNDILTAGHLVYDPAKGGEATRVNITLARDGSSRPFDTISGESLDYIEFTPRNAGYLSKSESQSDLAVIGLDEALGDSFGWLELAYFEPGVNYQVTGYPSDYRESGQPRMIDGSGLVNRNNVYDVGMLNNFEISPGSSGSPLWAMSDDSPLVMGVVSTKSWAVLVEGEYARLQSWIAGNDYLVDIHDKAEPIIERKSVSDFSRGSEVGVKGAFSRLLEDYDWSWSEVLSTELASTDTFQRFLEPNDTLDPVIRLYTGMLGRPAEKEGVEYWICQVNNGNTLYELSQSFVTSTEFNSLVDRLGGGNAGFIDALYQNVLGRSADGEGREYWLNTLKKVDADKAEIALAFTDSEEYITSSLPLVKANKLLIWGANLERFDSVGLGFSSRMSAQEDQLADSIVRIYAGVLDRTPDRDGFEYWLEEAQGEEGLLKLAENVIESKEFLAGAEYQTADKVLDALYHQVLGRAPDPEGEGYWQNQLEAGEVTLGGLVLAFTESTEFQQETRDEVDDFLQQNLDDGIIGVGADLDTYLLG